MPARLPRILIISNDQWTRAGLRAELRERGFDAMGARDVAESIEYARPALDRGPTRLILLDHGALGDERSTELLHRLRRILGDPDVVLIAHANRPVPDGDWGTVLKRPISIGEIADRVALLLPNAHGAGPLDI